jgi:tryptophan-rich sensory protein
VTATSSIARTIVPASLAGAASFVAPNLLAMAESPQKPANAVWYASLRKPRFNPPEALMPLIWTAIESLLAFTGFRLLRRRPSPARNRALAGWGSITLMIGGWSLIFFGRKNLAASAVASAAMVAGGVYTYRTTHAIDPQAARAVLPFIAWTAFATVLSTAIWRLNRSR